MDRIVNLPLKRLAICRSQLIADFHPPAGFHLLAVDANRTTIVFERDLIDFQDVLIDMIRTVLGTTFESPLLDLKIRRGDRIGIDFFGKNEFDPSIDRMHP